MVALGCADHAGFLPSLGRSAAGWRCYARVLYGRYRAAISSRASRRSSVFHCGRGPVSRNSDVEKLRGVAGRCDFIIASRPGFRLDALRLVIPPEKLGRTCFERPEHDCAAEICGAPADHGVEPRLVHRSPPSARKRQTDSWACARARGGIHSGTGPLPVTINSLRPEIRCGRGSGSGQAGRGYHGAESFRRRRVRRIFSAVLRQSQPQIQAIGEAIEERSSAQGRRVAHREGKSGAEWVLLDYGDFVVHIFSERARQYYDLERLWRTAERIDFPSAERLMRADPE